MSDGFQSVIKGCLYHLYPRKSSSSVRDLDNTQTVCEIIFVEVITIIKYFSTRTMKRLHLRKVYEKVISWCVSIADGNFGYSKILLFENYWFAFGNKFLVMQFRVLISARYLLLSRGKSMSTWNTTGSFF